MKYAVIQLTGKQYKVSVGDSFVVNRLPQPAGETMTIADVLCLVDGENVTVGTPVIPGAKVMLKVVSHQAGEKLRVATYHAKSRYRRTRGHRQLESTVEVVSIA